MTLAVARTTVIVPVIVLGQPMIETTATVHSGSQTFEGERKKLMGLTFLIHVPISALRHGTHDHVSFPAFA